MQQAWLLVADALKGAKAEQTLTEYILYRTNTA